MTGDVQIYGGIGAERNEISFENVKAQLDRIKSSDSIALHIWSPGGDVFEGEAIYNLLKNSGKPITTYVEGTCASIGTLIAAAGDKVIMNTTSRWMIHNPKVSGLTTSADARDLRHIANQLDKIKTLLIDVWDKRTTIGKERLWELYDNETWLTADEAKQMGFADSVEDAIKAVAKVDLKKFKMKENQESLLSKIINLFKLSKIKNEFTETLADGRAIIVMSDTEDWTGKQVMYADDMSLLEPGDYQMADGKVLSVGDGGMISQVSDAAPQEEQPSENEMKENEALKAKLAEVEALLAAAEASKKEAQTESVAAKAATLKFENRLSQMEEILTKASQTVGEEPVIKKGPAEKFVNKQKQEDPMGDFAVSYYKNRNIIQDEI
jgi:ATP-dependent protease ClpP protease subunit